MNERFELIKPYIKDKTALDIGCCGLYSRLRDLKILPYYESEIWLHNKIKKYAASVTGIDVSKKRSRVLDIKRKGLETFVEAAK